MKAFLFTLIAAFFASTLWVADAEAKRFGGSRSFGSKGLYSSPYKRSPAVQAPTAKESFNARQRNALSSRGGLWGILGGLALGGLLGALFFGGAFEGFNFFDVIVLGLIAFLLYKLFRTFAQRARPQPAAYGPAVSPEVTAPPQGGASLPQGFDARAFLEGAKAAFMRLQEAWDKGDLGDIRRFTTDPVYQEIARQLAERQGENRTEVSNLDAELLDAKALGDTLEAAVLFTADVRENGAPSRVEEVWHFIRPAASDKPTWYLDGIQQVAG